MTRRPHITDYADAEMMVLDLANIIAGELGGVLAHEDRATLVVPGGTTPGPVFDALSAADIGWDRVDVMLTDERWVPEDDPMSNAGLVRRRLLTGRAAAATFLPFYTGAPHPDDTLAEVEAMLVPYLPAAVVLLGMGTDMHTASLFPGADGLAVALDPAAPVLAAIRVPGQDIWRVTLTARVLREALAVHLIVTGAEKRLALDRAAGLAPVMAPVAAISDVAQVHWAP